MKIVQSDTLKFGKSILAWGWQVFSSEDKKSVEQPKLMSVNDIFNNVEYVVPIYQRNYAWGKDQIDRLIQDIRDVSSGAESYYLGSLIVNQAGPNRYEVIDGQQRLTTLYLISLYLDKQLKERNISCRISVPEGTLSFEAREKSNDTFRRIKNGSDEKEWSSEELINGFKIIEDFFKSNFKENNDYTDFVEKLKKVKIVRVQVPKGIDLNHYFEIMNTRGEQLEPHEIAKARIINVINDAQKETAAKIWDACALMDSYVQMNFDTESRKKLFGEEWKELLCDSFDSAAEKLTKEEIKSDSEKNDDEEDDSPFFILGDFLQDDAPLKEEKKKTEREEQERFESIISFSNFLLQVNSAISDGDEEGLDDKHFLKILEHNWSSEEAAKRFVFMMLKCRYLFDKYIIKREYYRDYKEEGRWMLQGIKSYKDESRNNVLKPQYYGTYNGDSANKETADTDATKKIRTLEACLRITYTSPKMMHWITIALQALLNNENSNLVDILEKYCREKVRDSNYQTAKGFQIERIVFSFLDYLLWRDTYSIDGQKVDIPNNYQYQYRTSIEHFYPQNPAEMKRWNEEELNSFGNLALITTSGNSKFSNNSPAGKIQSYNSIIKQSPKLMVMEQMTKNNNNEWTCELARKHEKEMLSILEKEVNKLV